MVDKARVDAQNHWFVYNEPMSVESVTQSVSNLAMMFGEDEDSSMVRGEPSHFVDYSSPPFSLINSAVNYIFINLGRVVHLAQLS